MGPSQCRAQIIGADAHEGGDEEEEFCGENDGDGAVERRLAKGSSYGRK